MHYGMLFSLVILITLVYTIGSTETQEFKLWVATMKRYSFSELLSMDLQLPLSECAQNALRAFRLLRQPKYASACINVLGSYSRRFGHRKSHGICMSNLSYPRMSSDNKRGKNAISKIRLAQLNVCSINKKAASLYDIILNGKLDFLCLS